MPDDSSTPAAETPAAVQPLTYRDLQRAILFGFAVALVWHLAEPLTTLLLFFLLVFILAAVLNQPVARLARRGVPRLASAGGIVLVSVAVLAVCGWLIGNPLVAEFAGFVRTLDQKRVVLERMYYDLARQFPDLARSLPPGDEIFKSLSPGLTKMAGALGRYTVNAAVAIGSLFLLVVLVVYVVAQPAPLLTGLLCAVPERHRERTARALRRSLVQLQNWARGSLILGVTVGVVCGVGLALLGVPNALLLGIVAGIGEMIPNVGPILSAVPPLLMALTSSYQQAAGVLILFIVVQQVENSFLVPRVMGQVLNLHPVSVLFVVLVTGLLFGLLGAILAVPLCAIIKVFYEEFYLIPSGVDEAAVRATAESIAAGEAPVPAPTPPPVAPEGA